MATIEIHKKSASVWTHIPSDFDNFIQSRFRCKVVGDYFRVVEFGGRQLSEYLFSDVTVYDDTQGGGAETFSSSEELMLRLESLEYPAFTQGSGGGGVGFQPVVVNPQNGETLIYDNGVWKNGYLDLNGNRFITVQEIPPIVNGEITLPDGFVWVINTNNYFNANVEVFEIEEATAGFYRTDIIVAQASETQPFVYIQGEESEDTAVPPIVPDNTLLVTSIPVFGDQIGTPTAPIDGSEFIKKISEQWASYILTGVGGLPILPQINENNRNINITGNPTGLSSLGGFSAYGGASIANFWDGMTAKVLNSSPNNQTIKHNYSGADVKYLFPNEEDYIIRPNEVVYFDLEGGNLVFRYSTFLNAKNVFFDDTVTQLGETNVQGAIKSLSERGFQEVTDISNTTSNKVGIGTDESTGVDGNVSYLKIGDGVPTDEVNLFAISKTYEVGGTTSGRNGQNIEIRATGSSDSPSRVSRALKSVAYINPNGFNFTNGGGSAMGVEGVARVTGINAGSVDVITGGYFVNNISAGNVKVKNSIAVYINGTQNGSSEKLDNVFGLFVLDQNYYHQATDNNVAGIFLNQGNNINSFSGKWAIYNNKIDPNYFRDRVLIGTNNLEGTDILKVNGNSSFYGDVLIDDIKAPSAQEYNVTVDDTGKLKSEPKPTIPTDISDLIIPTANEFLVGNSAGTEWEKRGLVGSDLGYTSGSGWRVPVWRADSNSFSTIQGATTGSSIFVMTTGGPDPGRLKAENAIDSNDLVPLGQLNTILEDYTTTDDLGSAAFEDSDVEPVTGTIPLRYGLGEGRVKVGNGVSEKDAVNKSQLDSQAVGRIRVSSWVISLNKSQINNLNTTPISVLWSDMGLTNTQSVRWRPELTAVNIDDDGTPFSGPSPIQVGRYPIQGVVSIPPTRYGVAGIYSAFPVQDSVPVGVEPEFTIETAAEITGGGSSARIQIMLFYEIDTITF